MKKYQYILLDWDGNLARTLDIWLASLKASLEQRGHFLSDVEIGADFAAFKERMQDRGIADLDVIIEEADVLSYTKIPDVELYPDTLEVLEYLHKAGKKLALVTTSVHAQIDPLIERFNLGALFDTVVCGDDVTHTKPSAEPLEKAMSFLGADKASTVMVGDSEKDIAGATNAGVDSILFYPPMHTTYYDLEKLQAYNPTLVIEDFRELKKTI
jgi:HAD superfamily hydrolase (TIGR01549 family)